METRKNRRYLPSFDLRLHKDEFYYLRHQKLMEFWNRMETGGRKSFRYEELEKDFFLKGKGVILVPYLDGIQKDLEIRE